MRLTKSSQFDLILPMLFRILLFLSCNTRAEDDRRSRLFTADLRARDIDTSTYVDRARYIYAYIRGRISVELYDAHYVA